MTQPSQRPPLSSNDRSEEARAFLQARVTLLWKIIFFIVLSSVGVGLAETALGAPLATAHLLTAASALLAAIFWRASKATARSFRFSRFMESGALWLHMFLGAFIVLYSSSYFVSARALETVEGALMANGLFQLMAQGGSTMLVAIRAALIPSPPRRTAIVSLLLGLPILAVPTLVDLTPEGTLQWHPTPDPWVPGMSAMLWLYAVATCTVITSVIYGLRKEVRAARQLGQYVLGDKLGEGGMGEVFEARHSMMRRPSAVKLLKQEQAGNANLRRFEQEVTLTARLTHPNTITIFDYGRTADNVFYYAMELIEGATLKRVVEVSGPQDPSRVVRILSMACGALHEAHGAGLIHRDIKPANIMLCTQGAEPDVVKLLDFGLVKEVSMEGDVELTQAGAITGTPQYLSPEAIVDPNTVGPRSDLYALGAVAYYLLAGTEPFQGRSVVEVCSQHLHQRPPPFEQHGVTVPTKLETLVFQCMEKEVTKRPQTASELRSLLDNCEISPWSCQQAESWWLRHPGATQPQSEVQAAPSQTLSVQLTGG